MRRRSRSGPARPYICRLSILMRLTWPSTEPELHRRLRPLVTASWSARRPVTKERSAGSPVAAAALVHKGGEGADAGGDRGELGRGGEDGVQAGLVGVGEIGGAGHDPAGH